MTRRSPHSKLAALALATAVLPVPALAATDRPVPAVESLAAWTEACHAGFRLSAMPDAWEIGPGQAVTVTTRLAIDFDSSYDENANNCGVTTWLLQRTPLFPPPIRPGMRCPRMK